jgi:hypothetical protein
MAAIMTFRIGLNMAGAVSAGAYTAGVLDFLVQALDAWYDERARQLAQFGTDTKLWTVPTHDVVLQVLTGASAGGMCAAISSVALQEEFDHVTTTSPPEGTPVNRLYQSWVQTIDILPLLGAADLPDKQGPVKSLLDSTPIAQIAQQALVTSPGRLKKRTWVEDPLGIILTLSNLRGIPYSVDDSNQGSFEERVAYHADQIRFAIGPSAGASTPTTIALNYSNSADPNWDVLRTAAMATGAFPVMLAARILTRTRADYENRLWEISNEQPTAAGECESETEILPDWAQTVTPTFQNVYADGGVTNNNPFECAQQFLVDAAHARGHNPRAGGEAHAAVITVAPFPGEQPFDPAYDANANSALGQVASALVGTLVNQSRFQGEDLKLIQDPDVYSHFAIAPRDDENPGMPALLSGALGAFGGFIDEKFRDRDYQLGRRNCQQFLRTVFMLPANNPVISAGMAGKQKIMGGLSETNGNTTWYPVIPLMPDLQAEIKLPPRADFQTTKQRLEQVANAAADRLENVVHAFVDEPGHKHPALLALLKVVFDLGGKAKIRDVVLEELTTQLQATRQIEPA